MREELDPRLAVGEFSVADAIGRVEDELLRWHCEEYSHITRGIAVRNMRIIHLETIFSQPSQSKPVPTAVALVHFFFDVMTEGLTYQFEEEHVQHTVGGNSLAKGQFQRWLDRIIGDKLQVRQLHDLATPFESTRLVPPAVYQDEEVPAEEELRPRRHKDGSLIADDDGDAKEQPPADAAQDTAEKLSLSNMLENIFDAADETNELELTHKEVADLLYATPLGLADWDVKLLLTTAAELETGRIEYKPFVQAAPEIIEALLKRRAAFEARTQDATKVAMEMIELCYWEEIEEVARAAREAFASWDAAGRGVLARHDFRTCLNQRGDRFSSQEVQMLMQMCKEDDNGTVEYEDMAGLLLQLRLDSLHNASVETDPQALMIHLIRLCQREGMGSDNILEIWELRQALLHADQLCLSRMQIHVILMIVHPNEHGEVDVEYFLRVCCTVIPYMFNTNAFAEMAAQIQKDKQDAQAKQELEELQGFAGGGMKSRKTLADDDLDQEDSQANAPDREAVEKELLQRANADQNITKSKFMTLMNGESLQHLQLSEAELRGFIAEAEVNDDNRITFVDHIKTWVPIIFELRKARIYERILSQDWGSESEHLVDIDQLGARAWLRPPSRRDDDSDAASQASRRSGALRRSRPGSARRSKSGGRLMTKGSRRNTKTLSRGNSKVSLSRASGSDSDSDSAGSVRSARSGASRGRNTSKRRMSSKRMGTKR